MRKEKTLTDENFNQLLHWLHPDREIAGELYERIRAKLIKIFRYRGSLAPEELADQTIDRVSRKVRDIAEDYAGDPASYFYGVANKIHLESLKKAKRLPTLPPTADDPSDERERQFQCLDQCLGEFSAENRDLILHYYQGEKGDKIAHRKDLTESAGIGVGAFRMRIYRLKQSLQTCIRECLEAAQA